MFISQRNIHFVVTLQRVSLIDRHDLISEEHLVEEAVIGPHLLKIYVVAVRSSSRVDPHEVASPLILEKRFTENLFVLCLRQLFQNFFIFIYIRIILSHFFDALYNLCINGLAKIVTHSSSASISSATKGKDPSHALVLRRIKYISVSLINRFASIEITLHSILHFILTLSLPIESLHSYKRKNICY